MSETRYAKKAPDTWAFSYRSRIMGQVGEDAPLELFRTKLGKHIKASDVNTATTHLGDQWKWWIETQTHGQDLLCPRIKIRHAHKPATHLMKVKTAELPHTYHHLTTSQGGFLAAINQ